VSVDKNKTGGSKKKGPKIFWEGRLKNDLRQSPFWKNDVKDTGVGGTSP